MPRPKKSENTTPGIASVRLSLDACIDLLEIAGFDDDADQSPFLRPTIEVTRTPDGRPIIDESVIPLAWRMIDDIEATISRFLLLQSEIDHSPQHGGWPELQPFLLQCRKLLSMFETLSDHATGDLYAAVHSAREVKIHDRLVRLFPWALRNMIRLLQRVERLPRRQGRPKIHKVDGLIFELQRIYAAYRQTDDDMVLDFILEVLKASKIPYSAEQIRSILSHQK